MHFFKTWQQWLQYFHIKYGKFQVQSWTDTPKIWVKYGTEEYDKYLKQHKFINHREIFPDEILLDIDTDDTPTELLNDRMNFICNQITKKLKQLNFNYSLWHSGGTGLHYRLHFPELMNHNKYDQTRLKKAFKQFLNISTPKGFPHICGGNPTLVQLELATHRKGGTKTLVDYNNTQIENKFPKEILETYKQTNNKPKNFELSSAIPKEIKFLENGDFCNIGDGQHRALFVLAAYYSHFLDHKELFKKLKYWNDIKLNSFLSERHIWSTIRSVSIKGKRPLLPYTYLYDLFDELGYDIKDLKK